MKYTKLTARQSMVAEIYGFVCVRWSISAEMDYRICGKKVEASSKMLRSGIESKTHCLQCGACISLMLLKLYTFFEWTVPGFH